MNSDSRSDAPRPRGIEMNVREAGTAIGNVERDVHVHVYPPASKADADFDRLLPAYLGHLIQQVERLDLSSLAQEATEQDPDQAPPLAELYTSLDVLCGRERLDSRLAAEAPEKEGERQSATAFVSQHPRVALLGDPGSGKSTFANYLALVLAGEWLRRGKVDLGKSNLQGMATVHLERLGEDWSAGALLPLRVVLRDFAATRPACGQPADRLWAFVAGEMGPALAEFVPQLQRHFRDEGGLLILDGFDEVPETPIGSPEPAGEARTLRDSVKEAVRGFQSQYSRVRVLLTSRTYAYQDRPAGNAQSARRVRLPDFDVTVLAPFSPDQIDLFVDGWYAHRARRTGTGRLGEDATGRAVRLKAAIRTRPYLRDLVRRPLLLTLAAALQDWNQARLPENRQELYSQSVALLLFRWEGRREALDAAGQSRVQERSAAAWFQVPQAEILRAFEEMAFEAHRDQTDRTGAADIPQTTVVTALLKMKSGADTAPARVIEYIRDRAGLLLDRGGEVYCFPHRTFQEYLAASRLSKDRTWPRDLVALVRTDLERWREVVLLAGAIVAKTPVMPWSLAQRLCSPSSALPWPPGDLRWSLALLAGQMIVETGIGFDPELDGVDRECRDHVVEVLQALVERGLLPPPDRAAAGVALGQLGDCRPGVRLKDGLLDPQDFVELPAGNFKLQESRKLAAIAEPFQIARYPVTVGQYEAFITGGGYGGKEIDSPKPPWWSDAAWKWRNGQSDTTGWWDWVRDQYKGDGFPILRPKDYAPVFQTPNHPRVGVSWYEASAFCAWLTERLREKKAISTTDRIALPGEAQWEWTARWNAETKKADDRRYPWGGSDERDLAERCNMGKTGCGHTSAVGLFPSGQAGCGAMDLSGNIWEWSADSYDERTTEARVLRGGSWCNLDPEYLSCGCRRDRRPAFRVDYNGFRCVWVGGSAR